MMTELDFGVRWSTLPAIFLTCPDPGEVLGNLKEVMRFWEI